MPKKTKDVENKTKSTTTTKKTKTKSVSDVKKASTSKKSATTKTTKKSTKAASTKKSTTSKKSSLNKKTTKSKNTVAKKSTASKTTTAKKATKKEILEYYDLPYRYNETTVKILAQTPKKLFVYWDISDADRKNYINQFGENFFNNTVPVLLVHNKTLNYSFEVEINDFANCWYLDVTDSKCEYSIELGRRSKIQNYYIPDNYIYVASSDVIENPNDHILFENQSNTIYFRNVKNNTTYSKNISNISFIRNMGKIYNIKKLYDTMYGDESIIDINNPSSNNPTSTFK